MAKLWKMILFYMTFRQIIDHFGALLICIRDHILYVVTGG